MAGAALGDPLHAYFVAGAAIVQVSHQDLEKSFLSLDLKTSPSAEIARVESATCRRECDLSHARATLCGDRACRVRDMQARARFVPRARNPLRRSRVSSARNAGESAMCPGELEDENWRLASTTVVRGAICGAGS